MANNATKPPHRPDRLRRRSSLQGETKEPCHTRPSTTIRQTPLPGILKQGAGAPRIQRQTLQANIRPTTDLTSTPSVTQQHRRPSKSPTARHNANGSGLKGELATFPRSTARPGRIQNSRKSAPQVVGVQRVKLASERPLYCVATPVFGASSPYVLTDQQLALISPSNPCQLVFKAFGIVTGRLLACVGCWRVGVTCRSLQRRGSPCKLASVRNGTRSTAASFMC